MEGIQPRVSGTIILDQVGFMRELYGADVVAQATASLAAPLRTEIDTLLRGGWCSIQAAYELKAAVADLVAEDLFTLQRKVVRLGVERTLTTFWRFLIRQLSDGMLAKRAPLLYARTFDRGAMKLVSLRPGGASLELSGWPEIPRFDLVGLSVGIETVFTLAGRRDAHVETGRRGDLVMFEATWRSPAGSQASQGS